MVSRVQLRGGFILLILVGLLLGSASASATNELFFNEAIEIPDAENGLRTVEVDAFGNIYSSFGTTLFKLSAAGSVLEERTFAKEITATAVSPDSTKIALTTKSGYNGEDSIFVLSTGDLSTLTSSDTTRSNAYILEWSPNGGDLYSNGPNDGLIQLNRDTLVEEVTYVGNHTGTMACMDVSSSSGMVLTADENGLIHLWDNDGENIRQELQLQSTINDCTFGNNDEFYSVSTPTNGIRKWTISGAELKSIDINDAKRYHFKPNANEVVVHKTTPTQHVVVYDYLNEFYVDQIAMFHTFDDYVVLFDEGGSITNIITNSKVDHVVKYGTSVQRNGVGESGIDTDGDGVPDSLDDDDDGDGIEDNWDLNCADVGISCELLPDEELIRSIDITINETNLIVKQTFTLNKAMSASIRDLSRMSLDTDVRLSSDEAQLFADAVCTNLDQESTSSKIAATIQIENASLEYSNMDCAAEEGMTLVPSNDRTSHIQYSIALVYDLEINQALDDLEILVENHRFPDTGSMTELSDQHPIRITLVGPSIITKEYVPWHIQEVQVSFEVEAIEQTNEKLSPKSILSSPLTIGTILVGIFIVGFVAQRIYDRMSPSGYDIVIDDDDDEEDDAVDQYDDDVHDDYEEELVEDTAPAPVKRKTPQRKPFKSTSKRVPVRNKEADQAKELLQQSSNEVVRKRRARRSEHDTVTTKRRKLSDTQTSDAQPRRRRAVKRDVTSDEKMDDTLRRFVSDSPEE